MKNKFQKIVRRCPLDEAQIVVGAIEQLDCAKDALERLFEETKVEAHAAYAYIVQALNLLKRIHPNVIWQPEARKVDINAFYQSIGDALEDALIENIDHIEGAFTMAEVANIQAEAIKPIISRRIPHLHQGIDAKPEMFNQTLIHDYLASDKISKEDVIRLIRWFDFVAPRQIMFAIGANEAYEILGKLSTENSERYKRERDEAVRLLKTGRVYTQIRQVSWESWLSDMTAFLASIEQGG